MAFYDFAKHKKPLVKQRFGASKKIDQMPFETCGILMILEPKFQIGLQNYQKGIMFFTKRQMAFRHVEEPYKTCRKWRFRRHPNGEINHLASLGWRT